MNMVNSVTNPTMNQFMCIVLVRVIQRTWVRIPDYTYTYKLVFEKVLRNQIWIPELTNILKHMDAIVVQNTLSETFSSAL